MNSRGSISPILIGWLLSSANLIRGRGPSFLSATNFDLKVLSFLKVKLNLLCGPDFNPLGLERKKILSLVGGLTFTVDCEHRGYFSYILFFSFFFNFFFLQDPRYLWGCILFYNDYLINFYGFCSFDFASLVLPLCSTLLWTQLRGHGHTVQKFTVLKIYKIMIQ